VRVQAEAERLAEEKDKKKLLEKKSKNG